MDHKLTHTTPARIISALRDTTYGYMPNNGKIFHETYERQIKWILNLNTMPLYKKRHFGCLHK